jgi:hypothetical protein
VSGDFRVILQCRADTESRLLTARGHARTNEEHCADMAAKCG